MFVIVTCSRYCFGRCTFPPSYYFVKPTFWSKTIMNALSWPGTTTGVRNFSSNYDASMYLAWNQAKHQPLCLCAYIITFWNFFVGLFSRLKYSLLFMSECKLISCKQQNLKCWAICRTLCSIARAMHEPQIFCTVFRFSGIYSRNVLVMILSQRTCFPVRSRKTCKKQSSAIISSPSTRHVLSPLSSQSCCFVESNRLL